ncbi:MAG: recombinase family protein, partial [Acidobacteria bacterium]|nr:recombinase family protein [Acidobacteriota bacterium]
ALAARKARGLSLGNPANLTAEARRKGPEARKQIARDHKANRQASELAGLYKQQGHSLRAIATRLNSGGYSTRGGKTFKAESVRRLLRIEAVGT